MTDGEPRFVIAVGASAGGLEALETMFQRMPEDTGAAFVVLQHLSPDFESHMDELLGRRTRLRIRRVTEGMQLEPDTIYLNPPGKEIFLSGKRFLLTARDPRGGLSLPIDHFLRSLAQDVGASAEAVILSGTGSDGSRGVRAIHEAGGLVIAHSGESARLMYVLASARDWRAAGGARNLRPEAKPRSKLAARSGLHALRHPARPWRLGPASSQPWVFDVGSF